MNWLKLTVLISVCVLLLGTWAVAEQNKFGVADQYAVKFVDPVRVGNTLLPVGDYQIRHTMQDKKHIMVFRQLGVETPIEVSAECILVRLPEAAKDTRKSYILNDANERVLKEMVFKGDTAKHVF